MLENFWKWVWDDVAVFEGPGLYGEICKRPYGWRWAAARSADGVIFVSHIPDDGGVAPTGSEAMERCEERLLRDYSAHGKAALLRRLMQTRPVPPLP
jgi:hypothetical protein